MIPKLRFKADDGSDFSDWEKMTLGDVCVFVRNGYAYSSDGSRNHRYKLTRIESISGGVINDEKLGSSDEIDPRYRLVDGDILFSNINSLPYLGNVARYTNDLGEIYHGMNLLCIRPRANEINSIFLFELLGTSRIRRYEITHAKAAVNQCSLPSSDVKAMSLYCPSLPEQRKIADLLSAVDDVITAQEAEVAAWQERKKGVMQKIFNREVRFKADDGSEFPEWEEKRLGDAVSFINGRAYSQDELLATGKYQVLRVGNLFTNDTYYYSNMELEEDKYIEDGDLIYAWSATFGPRIYHGNKCIYHYHIWKLKFDDKKISKVFLNYLLEQDVENIKSQRTGGTMVHITKATMESRKLLFPFLPEQRKIADCLSSLDDVINQIQDELSAWKEFKKGLLQQMFV